MVPKNPTQKMLRGEVRYEGTWCKPLAKEGLIVLFYIH